MILCIIFYFHNIPVGNAGTGKTQVWKTLFKTYQNLKKKPVYCDLNPKAVTNDELYGIINPATRLDISIFN
jgi:dynein heavy chain